MKGDFSRRIFDADKHYAGVLHQQGRVWLDSDWNEDVFERLNLLREKTVDVVGFCGVPEPGAAFLIQPNPNATTPGDFLIGGGPGNLGRAYVNGVLCQMDAPTTYLTQPDLLVPPAIAMPIDGSALNAIVYLEVWQRLITALEDEALREVALGGPDTTARIKTIAQVRVAVVPQPSLVTCANALQFLPQPGGGTLTTLQPQVSLPADLCRLPDPNSFTGHQNRLYRVEIHEGGDPVNNLVGSTSNSLQAQLAQDAAAGATTLFLAQALTAAQIDAVSRWGVITITDNTGLSEKEVIASVANDGQSIALTQGLTSAFTTANNALVHGVARFKWSRDNASFAVQVTAVSTDRLTLTLSSLGRDQATAFRQGDLVEICDDASELGPARGHLTNLQSDPDPDQLTVAIADPLPPSFQIPANQTAAPPASPPQSPPISPSPSADRHPILRRWDGQGIAQVAFSEIGTPDMDLADGVQIQFGGANLLPGDYWQFTARSTDGSIEALTHAPPAGIVRHRSPLAVVSWAPLPPASPPTSPPGQPGAYSLLRIEDCRQVFPPLVDLPRTEAGLHIQQVITVNQQTGQTSPLFNDSQVLVSTIVTGINVQCDADVDPASATPPTCFLTVEVPGPVGLIPGNPPTSSTAGYNPVIVASSVSAAANTITWLPSPAAVAWLEELALNNTSGIFARFTLKGNFIWTQSFPPAFLDGEAYGFKQNNMISLNLPSGDRRRGGDFEMWFWLVAQPAALQPPIVLSQTSIFPGGTVTGTISLSSPATAGLSVQLVTDSSFVQVQPGVATFNIGFTSMPFMITAPAPGPTAPTNVTITATLNPSPPPNLVGSLAATLTVEPPLLQRILPQSPIPQGSLATGVITLNVVAPAGTVIVLSSSNPSVAAPTTPSIAAGGLSSVNFLFTTASPGTAVITATSGNAVTALVTVIKTGKEGKEGTEGKEGKEGKEHKEGKEVIGKEAVISEKATAVENIGALMAGSSLSPTPIAVEDLNGDGARANGRAFIRSDERPLIAPPD
jgi:hypothetical protein